MYSRRWIHNQKLRLRFLGELKYPDLIVYLPLVPLNISVLQLFKLKFSLATNGLDNPMKIRNTKRDIAKIKTVLREKELEAKGENNGN